MEAEQGKYFEAVVDALLRNPIVRLVGVVFLVSVPRPSLPIASGLDPLAYPTIEYW